MRVLSLNVNNFGGININEKPRIDQGFKDTNGAIDWNSFCYAVNCWRDNPTHDINATEILAHIKDYSPTIVILHEFDIGSRESKRVINDLNKMSFNIIYPNKTSAKDYLRSLSSITVMFVKDELLDSCKNPTELKRSNRWAEIQYIENVIIGVHVPYDENFWDTMIGYYEKNKNKKLMIIGDMNVYSENTDRRKKFDEILSLGAIDVWVAKKNPSDTPTFNSGLRIDYALMTPSLYNDKVNIEIDHNIRRKGFTDHSSIIIEF